jgi:MYXO-CTERM domain-containing protein
MPEDTSKPVPLLILLHGDNGNAHIDKLVRGFEKAARDANVALVAPRCPTELGCKTQSFWQWYQSKDHDADWLGRVVDAAKEKAAIDPKRIYAAGYSGGATYLGYYAPAHPLAFAAVAHLSGGLPYASSCAPCKYPVTFVIGAADPMITPYTEPLRKYYEACGGHEVDWQALRGVSHEGMLDELIRGRGEKVLAWLLARPSQCLATQATTSVIDAGATETIDAGPALQTSATSSPLPPLPSPSSPRVSPSAGCGCETKSHSTAGPNALVAAVLMLGVARLRRVR